MIKLFIGGKGSGKTKTLIEMVNNAVNESKGNVVCIEKGDKLRFDITSKARLIDTDYYKITDAEKLTGFIAGILASNSDITDIFVDSALKIIGNDVVAFEGMLKKLADLKPGQVVRLTQKHYYADLGDVVMPIRPVTELEVLKGGACEEIPSVPKDPSNHDDEVMPLPL